MKILPNKVTHSNRNNQSAISVCNRLTFSTDFEGKIQEVENLVARGASGLTRRQTAVQPDDASDL